MYGGSSKMGRGGGAAGRGTGAKRLSSSFPMLPHHRPSAPGGATRLPLGGSGSAVNSRNRASGPNAAAATEETFSLVSGNNPLAFAMIIRLAPDLVDEIRHLEAQGGTTRIKFDSNNSNGNVIDVGGKEFRFRWSQENGDLSDIYEERQSSEDGNGLLVESGCAWRKLNVQRILDESTTNRVKKLSEEAERKKESRKAIVLEHGNPSMKNQIKQLAAVETNPWKHFKKKKEPPSKKRKIEPPQVGGHFKPAYKSTTTVKSRHASSPVPSPPEQSRPPTSPLRNVNIFKSLTSTEDVINQVIGKDKTAGSFDKEIPAKPTSVVHEAVRKNNVGAKPMDLQNMLINLLKENPKGMSMKALEKAVGDSIPNPGKQIEAIMKKIATFQAPGKYLLKQGVESESFTKCSSESERYSSSPEEKLHQTAAAEDNCDQITAPEPDFKERVPSDEFEEQGQLNSKHGEDPNALEKIDIQQHSSDLLGEKKVSDNSEGHAGSSSDSGSDSDSESDSSDSGSDSGSHSRSRSRSPVGSGSGSSSDSDSDASSNSKEGSDEDVDIMTSDDDKESKHKLQTKPVFYEEKQWGSTYGKLVQGGNEEKQDDHESDTVEIEKDVTDGNKQETEIAVVGTSACHKDYEKPMEKTNTFSTDLDELQERQNFIGSLFDEGDNADRGGSRYEHPNSPAGISKVKYKRGMEVKRSDAKSEDAKRSKTDNSSQPHVSGGRDVQFQESSHRLPSDRLIEDPYKDPFIQAMNGVDRDGDGELTLRKGNNQSFSVKSSADVQQSGRRSFEQSAPSKFPDSSERMHNYAESLGRGRKYSEKSSHVNEGLSSQKGKFHAKYEDGFGNEKVPRNSKEGGVRGKQSVPFDSHHRKHGEAAGKFKDAGQVSGSFLGASPKDNSRAGADKSPAVNGRGNILQREYSDLELGELREPLPEEAPVNKRFERKRSFKQSENKLGNSDNWISDMNKGKPAEKVTSDLGKLSSPDQNTKGLSNLEGSYTKRNHEDCIEDLTLSQHRVAQSQPQSRTDNVEFGFQSNNLAETNGNSRQHEGGVRLGNAPEGYGESNEKLPAPQLHDTRRELVSHPTKEKKRFTSNAVAESADGRSELFLAEGNNSERKRRDSSSDENSCSYSKYEKDEPDIRGPIKELSQYKEYVQEYHDKYDSYCSLNKILEGYRKEFQKLGKELEHAKGRDMERYNNVLEQLKESYRRCGTRHKRLKKIFVVLHEELKHLKQRIKDFALSYSRD